MDLHSGDWVRTEAGEVGRVVHIARLTAFVRIDSSPEDKSLRTFLTCTLTIIDPPGGKAVIYP